MAAPSIQATLKAMDAPDAAMAKRLIAQGMMIPAQPRVLEELRQQMLKKQFDVRVLAKIINGDPGLVAMLFKACNNAAYREHQPFDSVDAILHAVGVRQTFNLVQGIAVASLHDSKQNRTGYEAFWARSNAIAQLGMLIADDRITVCNIFPDQAYLAGMFHDCGVPVLMRRFRTYCKEMQLSEPGRWVELAEEDKKYNADHCVVGYFIGKHWNLPDFICDCIRNHHEIDRIGLHQSRSMVAILQMAIQLYYQDQMVANPEWERVREEVLVELGLHDDALPEFADVILERFHAQD
ncbi:MAG: HDOD domain-containing protein [Betaproteobacteria bacterium]